MSGDRNATVESVFCFLDFRNLEPRPLDEVTDSDEVSSTSEITSTEPHRESPLRIGVAEKK